MGLRAGGRFNRRRDGFFFGYLDIHALGDIP